MPLWPWIVAHPWLASMGALTAVDTVRGILKPCNCPGSAPAQLTGALTAIRTAVPLPEGNGVYHGLVRVPRPG